MTNPGETAVPGGIETSDDFYAYAYSVEREAGERYADLADQMDVHNNPEVAELFRKMAGIEAIHARQILERAGASELSPPKSGDYMWLSPEGPETIAFEDVHYMMTPHQALRLALHNEQRAEKVFRAIAAVAADAEVKSLAAEIAEEEAEHVQLIENWLAKFPKPHANWAEDPDPPIYSE